MTDLILGHMQIFREKMTERGFDDEVECLAISKPPGSTDTSSCTVTKQASIAEFPFNLPRTGQSLQVLVGLLKNRFGRESRGQRNQYPTHTDAHLRANLEQSQS